MMTDRDPLRTIERRQRRDTGVLHSTLADAIENAVVRLGATDRPMTEADRRIIMAEVDRGLSIIWGDRPGSDSAIRDVILRDTAVARFDVLDATVQRWRKAMPRNLRERVESEARHGSD